MERRTHESPMDFEWQSRAGPGDVTSPFYQLAMKHDSEHGDKKRPYSVFDSPKKPQTPALREPNSNPYLFSQSPTTKPATTFPSAAFTTPRKLDPDVEMSSGAETSPENAGGEVTPDPLPSRSTKRNSLFNMYGRFAPSPGRGEIPKVKDFSNVMVRRVHKRRKRERDVDRQRHRVNDDSDQDSGPDEQPEPKSKSQPEQEEQRRYPTYRDIPVLSTLFTFLEAHQHAPRILTFYAQLAFNTTIIMLGLYLLIAFVFTIWSDINKESEKASAEILAEMSVCAKNFVENRCGGEDKRLPALEVVCDNWEKCMNQDPQVVGRAKLSAHAIAEIVNSFVEPISYKTLIFILITVISWFAVNSWTPSLSRNKANDQPSYPYMPHPSQHQHPNGHNPFAPSLPGLGYYGHPQGQFQGFDPQFTRTPRKGSGRHEGQDVEDSYQRQIDNGPESPDYRERAHPRTPSPVKKNIHPSSWFGGLDLDLGLPKPSLSEEPPPSFNPQPSGENIVAPNEMADRAVDYGARARGQSMGTVGTAVAPVRSVNSTARRARERQKKSIWKKWWEAIALDKRTALMMLKGGLPPTIVIAMVANSLRAYRQKELQDPMVAFSIFVGITMTGAGRFATMDAGLQYIARLLKAFLLGFATATGVSLLIMPTTSRGNVVVSVKSFVKGINESMDAVSSFVENLHTDDEFGESTLMAQMTWQSTRSRTRDGKEKKPTKHKSKAEALKSAVDNLRGLLGKLRVDLFYAKHEIAWGRLSPDDLKELIALLRSMQLPIAGMSMLPTIIRKLSTTLDLSRPATGYSRRSGSESGEDSDNSDSEVMEPESMFQFVEPLCDSLDTSSDLVKAGMHHALISLKLMTFKEVAKQNRKDGYPQTAGDVEASADSTTPGREGFTAHFEQRLQQFYARRQNVPDTWLSLKAFNSRVEGPPESSQYTRHSDYSALPETRGEFFIILFMEHLQDSLLQSVHDLVKFANSKVEDGTVKNKRLIVPPWEHIKEWVSFDPMEQERDTSNQDTSEPGMDWSEPHDPLAQAPDPEHLPAVNSWQRAGNHLRRISHILASSQSSFGFRVAVASLTVALLAYLHQTQAFYFRQRLIWVFIVIVIGMSPTSGASLFGFACRVVGTIISMALSLVVWYVPNGHTAGVIILLYLANCLEYYFYIKYPRFIGAAIIALITLNVVVGYELMVRKLGVPAAETSGQPYYPIYLFGPYRLLSVVAGCAISFVWVIFPYPISARSRVRKTLGRSLFVLAKFYSCMHTAIEVWMDEEQGDISDEKSPAYLLEYARNKLLTEQHALLDALRTYSNFTRYEPPIGGKFPKKTYDNIISEIQTVMTSMALMAHTTRNLEGLSSQIQISLETEESEPWIRHLARLTKETDFNSQVVTSVLCHLSAAVTNGVSLPPNLTPPQPFPLARQLRTANANLFHIRNMEDPAFSAFTSMEVLSSMVSSSLKNLVKNVLVLVGEVSFEFYVRQGRLESRKSTNSAEEEREHDEEEEEAEKDK
ncbi:hypothetical protein FQN54_002694 [Arachnomyces sp. PD_36]|nr:hypothetical protein FQN54_002694 [Arachnomyces sp. PD_36]